MHAHTLTPILTFLFFFLFLYPSLLSSFFLSPSILSLLSLSSLPFVLFLPPLSPSSPLSLLPQMRASISPIVDGESLRLSSVFTTNSAFLKIYKQYTDNYEASTQVRACVHMSVCTLMLWCVCVCVFVCV